MKILKRIGIIDIGSNSIRLVVFDGPKRSPLYLYNEKVFFRLGLQSFGKKAFDNATLKAVSRIINRYVAICRNMEISKIIMFGTSALREANNSNVLVEVIRKKTNIGVDVISGEKEAFYAAQGILLGFPNAEGIICDLGGNSVEFANICKKVITECNSTLLGPLAITKLENKIEDIDRYIRKQLLGAVNANTTKDKPLIIKSKNIDFTNISKEVVKHRVDHHLKENHKIYLFNPSKRLFYMQSKMTEFQNSIQSGFFWEKLKLLCIPTQSSNIYGNKKHINKNDDGKSFGENQKSIALFLYVSN